MGVRKDLNIENILKMQIYRLEQLQQGVLTFGTPGMPEPAVHTPTRPRTEEELLEIVISDLKFLIKSA